MNTKLLELLDLYYDSNELKLLEEPKTLNCSIEANFSKVSTDKYSDNPLEFRFPNIINVNKNNNVSKQKTWIGRIKEQSPNFFLQLASYTNVPISSQEMFKISYDNMQLVLYSEDISYMFEKIVDFYVKSLEHIPFNIIFSFDLTKIPNTDYIKQFCALQRSRNFKTWSDEGLSVKQSIDRILTNQHHAGYGRRAYRFEGTLKHNIYKMNKEQSIFVIEYLYGKKLSKSSSFSEIGKYLISTGINDFGLRDVQQLFRLYQICRNSNSSIKDLYNELFKILSPKGNLQRWEKRIKDVQDDIKV